MASSIVAADVGETDSSGNPSGEQILQSFHGEIQPIRETMTYRLGILAVSIVMVLLPLVYIALIFAVGYAVYWHTVNNVGMLEHGRGRGKVFVLLLYLTPLICGSIMTLFMMKPLFARSSQRRRPRSLTRDEEPLLFAFVDRVCQAVHAPRPKRIDIDCQVNASASFRRGFWSMLLGNDLVLTIGLPLVFGFSLRQFAGVLAHEFGHFSQGAGMRLTYVIRSISFWFTRVVYERDAWDEWLERTASQVDIRFGWVLHLARFFVWLSRRFLWVLMVIGHAVSSYMMRQMEFDADRHECRLAGSDVFSSTARRLIELNIAHSGAQRDLQEFYRDGRLGDDLPRLVDVNARQLPEELQDKITEVIEHSTTGKFDTHPCDKDRIKNAQRENAPGIFRAEGPATALFRDLPKCSREVTVDFYEQVFGDEFRREAVHPLDDLLARQTLELEARRALDRYFQGTFNLLRPFPIPAASIGTVRSRPQWTAKPLELQREAMQEAISRFQSAWKQWDETDTKLLEVHCASSVFAAHETPRADQFSFAVGSREAVMEADKAAAATAVGLESDLTPFETALRERFSAALELLFTAEFGPRLENVETLRDEAQRLLTVLERLNSLFPTTLAIRNTRTALGILFSYVRQQENSASLIERIRADAQTLYSHLGHLKAQLQSLDYPFDHAQGPLSLANYVIKTVPLAEDFGGLYDASNHALEQLASLASRASGRLAQIAETVEAAAA